MCLSTKSDIVNCIAEFIAQNEDLFDFFDNIYLFGSALNDIGYPNDIDLLFLYSKKMKEQIINFDLLNNKLNQICCLPVDLTVLTFDEEKEIGFLQRIGRCLKLK